MNSVVGISMIVEIDKSVAIFDGNVSEFAEAFEKLLEISFTNVTADVANVNSLT